MENNPLTAIPARSNLIPVSKAAKILGVCTRTVRRLARRDPTFPKIIHVCERGQRLDEAELYGWADSRKGQQQTAA